MLVGFNPVINNLCFHLGGGVGGVRQASTCVSGHVCSTLGLGSGGQCDQEIQYSDKFWQ